jgi:hypothetical protein
VILLAHPRMVARAGPTVSDGPRDAVPATG